MGCLQGKEQEEMIEIPQTQPFEHSSVERDPWWNMLRSSDLSLAYMRELEERIRIVERRNRINEENNIKQKARNEDQVVKNRENQKEIRSLEQKNKNQDYRHRTYEQRNRDQEEFNRNQQRINIEQENKNTIQEEKNRYQEKKNKEQEEQNMVLKYINNINREKGEDKPKTNNKQEGYETLMTQDSHIIINKDDMAKRILVENDCLETAVDIIRNCQQDISKMIEIFGLEKTYLTKDKETQTENQG